ncbi:DEAD-box ATP-dependent RNA helicase FANCM isoform X3 [Benincasa hispida]|uniref:DEAD-box ATP-dependent RNA helicase FANCM isoform X3 n=1 Tax=Benincasa hispida TaxID=102211 RepID=UPI0019003899|nr:DEAD-box ATP-dependent RNA helicase FANCM isoform X3 [Benincasa hispida]
MNKYFNHPVIKKGLNLSIISRSRSRCLFQSIYFSSIYKLPLPSIFCSYFGGCSTKASPLVSQNWDEFFEDSRVSRQARTISDHFPLLFEAGAFEWGPSPFRFCNSWLKNKECCRIIENSSLIKGQQDWAGFALYSRLRRVKQSVKRWLAEHEKDQKIREESLLKEIKEKDLQADTLENFSAEEDVRVSLKADLLSLYQAEERDLIQKSKLNWLLLGDENTSFFHRFLAAKRRKNLIAELFNEQGLPTKSFREIETIILDFFSNLYTKCTGTRSIPLNMAWSRVSAEGNSRLIAKFSTTEITVAIQALGKNKAPGPDGFTVEFILHFWNLLKDGFKDVFEEFYHNGKIVFTAPSRPLVLQQIEACHNIVGIPQEWTIDMTGLINPAKRAGFWKSKRVFFVTPQVLEKDIQSGTCLVKYLVCLVIDEAHRALGNYSYCVAVRELMMVPVPLRILALTATPGSKQQGIQQIIDNLHISTLQYRDESDHDVSPYVHDRKIELIEVPMGEDADEINNKLLEAMRPFVAKLCSIGILPNRDYRTLSPCDLLNSRDKFRQAPPPVHPHIKYQDVEGFFGVLITLYHIRKLLSSHGIRPASEMLEEKLQQGSFARFMSKNHHICKVRLIMEKSLTHGAPSPKLSKMMEVLVDHFKTKDPQDSRVIIFSNFRGSVRDIMSALSKIEDIIRATEFIGQSSGKFLKGQSQKVQQAVLEKFRAGGYNVIVATCIGEEGLDIMEVDLVICFDANISPIRMIQRMGRTGRKHDGRVVVLACEGSELKGYMKKQTTSKSIKKHMQNGGINSFNFHASSRMITSFESKLTDTETELLLKYFHPCEDAWRPSLIAFPHFQTFPSRAHGVMHSCRTMVLIDTMQHLQRLHFSREPESFSVQRGWIQEKSCIRELFEAGQVEKCSSKRGSINEVNASKAELEGLVHPEVSAPPNPAENNCSKLLSSSELGSYCLRTAQDLIVPTEAVNEPTTSQTKLSLDEVLSSPGLDGVTVLEDKAINLIEKIHQGTLLKRTFNKEDTADEKPVSGIEPQFPPVDESSIIETQISPRLTNLIESGVVPDSPIDDCGYSRRQICESTSPGINERINCNGGFCAGNDVFLTSSEGRPSMLEDNESVGIKSHASISPMVDETQTPLAIVASSCDNEDLNLVNGGKFSSVQKPRKFKRLRKVGDMMKNENIESTEKTSFSPLGNMVGTSSTRQLKNEKRDGERRFDDNVRAFIEEEAEVSSDATVSEDEDDKIKSSFDSFIDDRVSASATCTQDEICRPDMMAIYRRSLLSQSPFGRLTSPLATRVTESETSPGKTLNIFESTLTGNVNQSHILHSEHIKMNCSPEIVISATGVCPRATEVEIMNRNSTFCASESVPVLNLDKQFELVVAGRESISDVDVNRNLFIDDDEFYEGIDLDAVEAEAKLLLEKKVELPQIMDTQQQQNLHLDTSPSFDLGI